MNEIGRPTKRTLLLILLLLSLCAVALRTTGQESGGSEAGGAEQWEYLVVASPSATNFTPSGNSRLRKEPTGVFGREAFVLEQQMDKLGAKGWELVAVTGNPSEPSYYFKRRK